jgi:hypothetical protein
MTRRQMTTYDFPFVVKIPVPPGGLGKRLNAMHDFVTTTAAFSSPSSHISTMMMEAITCSGVSPALQPRRNSRDNFLSTLVLPK